MKTVKVYTAKELQKRNPSGFERAFENFKEAQDDCPWSSEIIDSLKATFKAAGITLHGWSIGAYSDSWVRFDMGDAGELSGPRAAAWLENNLYSPLRISKNTKNNLKYNRSYADKSLRPYSIGKIPPCPFTGVCFDEDYLETIENGQKKNQTLSETFQDLANTARRLFEAEIESTQTEEYFIEEAAANEYYFAKDGTRVYA